MFFKLVKHSFPSTRTSNHRGSDELGFRAGQCLITMPDRQQPRPLLTDTRSPVLKSPERNSLGERGADIGNLMAFERNTEEVLWSILLEW